MEILGIGPSELVFIIIIALIVLGPKDMQKAAKTVGRWLNDLVKSDGWKAFQQTSREIRNLPTKLMREANMELAETQKDLNKALDVSISRSISAASTNPAQRLRTSQSLDQPQGTETNVQGETSPAQPAEPEVNANTDPNEKNI